MVTIELLDTSQEDYLEYRVIHEDGSEGFADLRVRELSESYMRYTLRDVGLTDDSKIAELFFYPHSNTSLERSGIGSIVLDYILKDAAERNVSLVFAECTTLTAKSFFQKRGFEVNHSPHCYVLITPHPPANPRHIQKHCPGR